MLNKRKIKEKDDYWSWQKYMGNNFIYVFTRLCTRTNKKYKSSKLFHLTSAEKVEEIDLFKLKKYMDPLLVLYKSTFIFENDEALFSFGLKSKKNKDHRPILRFLFNNFHIQ